MLRASFEFVVRNVLLLTLVVLCSSEVALAGSSARANQAVYEDDDARIKIEDQPNKSFGKNKPLNSQHISIEITDKSKTKILKQELAGALVLEDNYGNLFKTNSVSPEVKAYEGIYPGTTKQLKFHFNDKLIPTANSLKTAFLKGALGNAKAFEAIIPVKSGIAG